MFKKNIKIPSGGVGVGDLEAAIAEKAARNARSGLADQEMAMNERKEEVETETETTELDSLPVVRRPGARDNRWRLNIFFSQGSAALDNRYHTKLDNLEISRRTLVYVAAYTDKEGPKKANWALAKKRAAVVYRYLRKQHPKTRFKVRVYGESIARFNYRTEQGIIKNNAVLVLVR